MKIFHRRFARLIYISENLEELLINLRPWINIVNRPDSPFMLQVASYFLRKQGSSAAPKFFKQIVASEIFRIIGKEDIECTILLAIIDAHKHFLYGKGTDIVNWLSWRVPYITSKYVRCIEVNSIEPFEEAYEEDYSRLDYKNRQLDIIARELRMSGSHKEYYRK